MFRFPWNYQITPPTYPSARLRLSFKTTNQLLIFTSLKIKALINCFLFDYECVCLHADMCMSVQVLKEDTGVGSTPKNWSHQAGCWEPNSGPLLDQCVLLNAEPSPQPRPSLSKIKTIKRKSSFHFPQESGQTEAERSSTDECPASLINIPICISFSQQSGSL